MVAAVLHTDLNADFSSFKAQELTKTAFNLLPWGGISFLAVALAVFACTTIMGWFCYVEQAIHYLGGKKTLFLFRIIFV